MWDLGDTRGTVAIRMPDHELAREILERTGPLAVSSANVTGLPAATDADQAEDMLGDRVAVIVDDGESPVGEASTIVDATGAQGRVLRRGALSPRAAQRGARAPRCDPHRRRRRRPGRRAARPGQEGQGLARA